jgi:hypothetical protein
MNDNWTSKNSPPELSDSDAELLSAYLDNMLDAPDRAALEARLATDAFLRGELAAMRQMLAWLKTMPQLKAPRNFTISETDVKPVVPKIVVMPRRNNWQLLSAAAAIFLVVLGFVAYLSNDQSSKDGNSEIAAAPSQQALDEAPSPLVASTSSAMLMPTLGNPPVAGGNNDSDGTSGSGGVPAEEQEAPVTGEMSELGRSAESDLGTDPEMNPVDSSGENVLQEATSTLVANGQAADSALAMPTGTAAEIMFYGTATMQATANAETVSEESMALTVQQDVAESTESMSVMVAPIAEEQEADDSSSANLASSATMSSSSLSIKDILRRVLQAVLDDIQH